MKLLFLLYCFFVYYLTFPLFLERFKMHKHNYSIYVHPKSILVGEILFFLSTPILILVQIITDAVERFYVGRK
jgi:hypothetical protein